MANGLCICWPGSLLARMGLRDLPFHKQVKEVYLGKQFFQKRQACIIHNVSCGNYQNKQEPITQSGASKGRFISSTMDLILGSFLISSKPNSESVM